MLVDKGLGDTKQGIDLLLFGSSTHNSFILFETGPGPGDAAQEKTSAWNRRGAEGESQEG